MNGTSDHPILSFNPFLLVGLTIMLALGLGRLIPLPFLSQTPSHIIGALIFLAGFPIAWPAARAMAAAKTSPRPDRPTTALVFGSTYRFTRNPIYLSMLFNFAGILIFLQNLWAVLILPVLMWLMTIWIIIPEESYLESKFGRQYMNYKARVRRWL